MTNLTQQSYSVPEHNLYLPVFRGSPSIWLTVSSESGKLHELHVSEPEEGEIPWFYAPLPVPVDAAEVEVCTKSDGYLRMIRTHASEVPTLPAEKRPEVHFTAQSGWINDPNGLIFADGVWHMYFQHNPFSTKWSNMCWGHAVSRDLLHWTQLETVMYPDENGPMFSGSAVACPAGCASGTGFPEGALLYFYSAAGGSTPWSAGRKFTQRIAVSTDGGRTLHKLPDAAVDTLESENRDPKVFYHAASGAYIMCLWLVENEFALLRSTDLMNWTLLQRMTLPDGYECPDLFELQVEDTDERVWVFWSADGTWYPGQFDGTRFEWDGTRHSAYANTLPYAAQTWSGVTGRVLTIPWLRCINRERRFTGAMGLPRELSLIRRAGELLLVQRPAMEWRQNRHWAAGGTSGENLHLPGGAVEVQIHTEQSQDLEIQLDGAVLVYCTTNGHLLVNDKTYSLRPSVHDFRLILDDYILEISADGDTLLSVLDLSDRKRDGRIAVHSQQPAILSVFAL